MWTWIPSTLHPGLKMLLIVLSNILEQDTFKNYYTISSPNISYALMYAVVDNPTKTLEYIEKAYQEREATIVKIYKGLDFRILSDNPSYQELLSLMYLTE